MNQIVKIAVIFVLGLGSPAVLAKELSVREAIALALANHPDLLKAEAAVKSALAAKQALRSTWRPQVEVTALGGLESGESDATRRRPGRQQGESGFVTLGASDVSLSLSQKVFDGFAILADLSAAGRQTDAAVARRWLAAQTVAEQVAKAYGDVLVARARLGDASLALSLQKDFLQTVHARIGYGAGKMVDAREVEGRIARFEGSVADLSAKLSEAEALYAKIVGSQPGDLLPVTTLDMPCPGGEDKANVLANSPALLARKLEVQASDDTLIAAQRRLYTPVLTMQGGAGESFNRAGVEGMSRQAQLALVAKVNLYRGGGDQAAIDSAIAGREDKRADLESIRRDVAARYQVLTSRLAVADHATRQAKRRVAALADIKRSGDLAFQVGTRSVTDLLNIELELVEAKSALVEKIVGKMVDRWALAALAGTIHGDGATVCGASR